MEARFRHLKKKYNSVSHNNEILSHNYDLVSRYIEKISRNNDLVPFRGNFKLRPLGVAMGNAVSWLKHTYKNTTCWPATAYDVTTGATTV